MAAGKAIAAAAAVAGIAAAIIWRRRSRPREHVDLFFSDGSMVSFEQGSIEAARLLPLAHEIVAVAPNHP
jgi:hypothetical protein